MRRRLGDLLAFLVLVALGAACFARLVARPGALIVDGERPSLDYLMKDNPRGVGNDLTFLFLPHYLNITAQMERCGRLPFWDSSGFAGRPMIGNPQGGLFYPPVWLAWAARSPAALGWLTVAHLLWGGIGAFVLARGLGMSRLSATLTAGCFQAAPYVLAQTFEGHYPHVWAATWFPWAFWAFTEHRAGRLRGSFALPPLLGLIFLTGHPQEWYYLVFTLSVWTTIDAAREGLLGRRRRAVTTLAAWAGLVALSFGLVALELIPDIAAEAVTLRSGKLTLAQAGRYTPHSVNLFQLLNPFALGGPSDYIGHQNYWEELLSFGLVPLALALIALSRHPRRRQVAGWFTLTAATLVFSHGHRLYLFTLLYHWVPGMNRFRVPSRALFLTYLGAAVLAGFGVEALRSAALSAENWRVWLRAYWRVVALVVTVLLVGEVVALRFDTFEFRRPKPITVTLADAPAKKAKKSSLSSRKARDDKDDSANEVEPLRGLLAISQVVHDARFWFLLGGTCVVLTFGGRLGRRRVMAWGLSGLALVELGLYGHALIRVTPAEQFLDLDPVTAALAAAAPPVAGPFRIRARDVYYDDLHASAHGFEKININDWFQIQRAADLYQTLYPLFEPETPPPSRDVMGQALRRFGREIRQTVLDRLGVAFLVSDHVDPEEPWPIVATGRWQGQTFAVHRNPTVLPRAYVVPRAYPTGDQIARELALFRQVNPREAVLMKADPLPPLAPRQPFTPAEWIPTDSDHVIVRVETRAAGLLVVADTWLPGWSARVDGKRVPILRGNHAQRVVPLTSAGRHEVVMSYEPPGFFQGLAVTAASALLWLVSLLLVRRSQSMDETRSSKTWTTSDPRAAYPPSHLSHLTAPAEHDNSIGSNP